MHTTIKVLILAAVAAAAMTASVSPASAGWPVNLEAQPGTPCPAITPPTSHGPGSGGCPLIATSSGQVEIGTALGMTLCTLGFEGRVNGNGEGYIYAVTSTNCSPITVIPCASPEGGGTRANWPFEFTSETSAELVMCIVAFGITVNCHLNNITAVQGPSHVTTYGTGTSHRFCETSATSSVQGLWNGLIDAGHPAFELIG